jgi:hypothetical protein
MSGKEAKAVTDRTLTMAPRERVSNGKKAWAAICAEEVDGKVLFKRGTIAEVIVKRQ